MKKTCNKCNAVKNIIEFYKHKRSKDGYINQCKECVKYNVEGYRQLNIDKIKEYDRLRGSLEHRKQNNRKVRKNRKNDPEKIKKDRQKKMEWREKNRIKRACHVIVGNAIKYGTLTKQDCFNCGASCKSNAIDAHHEDYSKPLDVIWLCKPCHGNRHKEINEERRKQND